MEPSDGWMKKIKHMFEETYSKQNQIQELLETEDDEEEDEKQ